MSKRLLLAKAMHLSGLTRLVETLRAKPGILLINHHRIGDAKQSRFDQGVFSATVDQLDEQVKYLKKWFPVLGAEELEDLVWQRKPLDRGYVGITFDDGYRDNYTNAFPVLKNNGCCGMFFLVPTYVGTNAVPWWDEIAYLVRHCKRNSITLDFPVPHTFALDSDREPTIRRILQLYKRPDNTDHDLFMSRLRRETECTVPDSGRRFLTWDEAREMKREGMVIGSHTWSHRILAQLQPEEQKRELVDSRIELEKEVGSAVATLAYPVGSRSAFSHTTQQLAREAGYKLCFSFYGGVNANPDMIPEDVRRTSVEPDALMFRNQVAFLSRFGRMPY